ncbi:MAG: hypothetical protein ACI8WB_005824 [Phenylobacterium sp.]|jgi:hypothetical protein
MKHFLFICVFIPFFSLAKNSFLVAPGIVEFDLKKPATRSFIITNDGDEAIRLNIKPIYFDIADRTMAMGEHLTKTTKDIENITGAIRISPRRLSLKPGQRRDIRVSIRPKKNLPDGDYRSHLLVQMLQVAHVLSSPMPQNSGGVGMDINVKMETAVAIYGSKGQGSPTLNFFCQQNPANGKLMVKIVNPTIWRFDGPISITANNTPIFNQRLVRLRDSSKTQAFKTDYLSTTDYQIGYNTLKNPDAKFSGSCQHI